MDVCSAEMLEEFFQVDSRKPRARSFPIIEIGVGSLGTRVVLYHSLVL